MKRFWEIKGFGLGRLPTRATTFQEVWIFPTLVYFPPKDYLVMFSTLRGYLAVFFALRGCLGRISGMLGMLPCFDPTHCPEFGTGFWLGNGGNLDLCSS